MDPAQKDTGRLRVSDVYRVGVTDRLGTDWRRAALTPGARTRWLLEHAAAGLGKEPPAPDAEEIDWVTSAFSETNALTLYVAARALADEGHPEEALEVLGDACRAQQNGRSSAREARAATAADAPEEVA
jgi:hypothetical protein